MNASRARLIIIVCLAFMLILQACGGGGGGTTTNPPQQQNPAPAVSSLSPDSADAGGNAFTLTINGSGFISSSTVQWNGVARACTYVSASQLQVAVAAADLTAAGTIAISVKNPAPGGGTASANFSVKNPAPVITSISPSTVTTVDAGTAVNVYGTGFVSTSVVTWNGASRTTTFVSGTQVQLTLAAGDIATPGTAQIAVSNPAPGGGTSAAAAIKVQYPVPVITSLNPSAANAGGSDFTLTVRGSGFAPTSTINWKGAARSTTFIDSTRLTTVIPASEIATPGTASVSVTSPAPGGGTSGSVTFSIGNYIAPTLTYLSPSTAYVNSPDTAIWIYGTGFLSGSVVKWNGTELATTFFDPGHLSAAIPASLLKATGKNNITVANPVLNVPESNALTFEVLPNPVPTVDYVSPSVAPVGSPATKITLSGSGYTAASVIRWNGKDMPTSYPGTYSYSLSTTVPSSELQLLGTSEVTVFNPSPGGGTSNKKLFTTYLPLPANDILYNPATKLLYVSVPSSAGSTLGNSIVSVDPSSGVLGDPIWVGSEPNKLALSSDGKVLWVGLDGTFAVRRVDLTTGKPGVQFSLLDPDAGYYSYNSPTAADLKVVPGTQDSVAVLTAGTVAIYDNGVKRPKTFVGPSTIAFGSSAGKMYAASSSSYYVLNVDSTGVAVSKTISGSYFYDFKYDNGRAYFSSGQILDAETGSLLGTLAAAGPVEPDSSISRTFILEQSGYSKITVFDQATMTPTGTIDLNSGGSSAWPTAVNLVRWGQDGLAFQFPDKVFILRNKLVRDLTTAPADVAVSVTAPTTGTTGTNMTYGITVSNNGPNAANNVVLIDTLPANVIFVSSSPTQGQCGGTTIVRCNLGTIASGANAVLQLTVTPKIAGELSNAAMVTASEGDSNPDNNSATTKTIVSGNDYNELPSVLAITPNLVKAGSDSITVNVSGSGFTTASVVKWNGADLPTTFTSGTQISATVDAAKISALGWAKVQVANPAPGGGSSNALPFTVYQTVSVTANKLLFEPFTRKLIASIPSTSTDVAGNTVVGIDPATGAVASPVWIGSEPKQMALSDDGQYLYVTLSGSKSVRRFDLPSQTPGLEFTAGTDTWGSPLTPSDLAVMPGRHDTVAISRGEWDSFAIYDINGTTVTKRPNTPGIYNGTVPVFGDASNIYTVAAYGGSGISHYTVDANGVTLKDHIVMPNAGYALAYQNGLLFGNYGYVVSASEPESVLGRFATSSQSGAFVPDAALGRVFFLSANSYGNPAVVSAYDQSTFLFSDSLNLQFVGDAFDIVRWGSDGLAFRTAVDFWDNGQSEIVLVRGPFVLPRLMVGSSTPSVSAVSPSSAAAGSGNLYVTVTGTGFVPGAVVFWGGEERTTMFVDSSHLKVAIPASDLAKAGTGSVKVANPGSNTSGTVSFTIN